MKNVVCWDPSEVRRIINPFAEHMPNSLFRAVHTDWTLKVSPPVGTSFQELVASPASYADMTPPAFLDEFLRDDRPHILAVVLGETGSGKSHLIRWMRLNMKDDERRMVLVVRKSGTSLRAIVEMIIDRLPRDEQQGFRDTLNRAGDGTATPDGQKQQLLNDIAHAIREDVVSEKDGNVELEDALIRHLPDIFQDPYMRQAHFLKKDGIVAEIVDHIFAPSSASNRPDKRHSFKIEDMPLGGMDFVNASKNAKDALKVIDLEPGVTYPMALRIINRNLGKATSRTLSFSGDRVEELMGRLRTHLKKQGRELVLLVEEFARLQGIDRALLQAITNQGDGSYCRMRSAIAVTTGFFESVAETAYMRTTHIIDMDRSAARKRDDEGAQEDALSEFAARYLNAVRLGTEKIADWSNAAEPGENPPSKCSACGYRPECHPVFGEVEGYGLYPFTRTALQNASGQVHRSKPETMNPRILQNEVLAEVLDVNEAAIKTGHFPSMQFVEKLGMEELKVNDRGRLKNVGAEFADRVIPFLEFYDGTGRLVDLPSGLRKVFDIPEIPDDLAIKEQPAVVPSPGEQTSPKIDLEEAAINEWLRGGSLDQRVAQTLREAIFSAVSETIDWDILGLERSTFLGPSRHFQRISVNFDRATTGATSVKSGAVRVKLSVPGDLDPDKAGLALIGLLRAGRQQFNWDFDQGPEMLAAFLDCLEDWSADVERQLRELTGPRDNWEAPRAALELLCLGAAIGGKVKPDSSTSEIVDAALGQWPDSPCEAPELRSLHDRLRSKRDKLFDIVRAQISLMKGGRVGAMIDPQIAASAIRTLRTQKWLPMLDPPANEKGDYADLSKLYSDAKSSLEAAVLAERTLRLSWLKEMDEAFGSSQTKASILTSVRNLKEIASENGLAGGGNANAFASAIDTFAGVQFEDAIAATRGLAEIDGTECLPHLGRGRRAAVTAGRDLKRTAVAFLQSVETNLQSFVAQSRAENDKVEDSISSAEGSLIAIETSLSDLSAPDEEPVRAA